MVVFAAFEVGSTPILFWLAEEGFAITVPLGYLVKALAYVPPFLMFGAVLYELCEKTFFASLNGFWIYTVIELLVQIPIAIYDYSSIDASPYWLLLLLHIGKALLNCLFFFFLILLVYLIFLKRSETHQKKFFGFGGSDTRALGAIAAAIALQDIILFIVSFAEHMKEKAQSYQSFDFADFQDILISLAFIALCAFISYCSGRFSMVVLSRRTALKDSSKKAD